MCAIRLRDKSTNQCYTPVQTKLLLWLECDQYLQNVKVLSDADVHQHGLAILRKFFQASSRFSLLGENCTSDKVKKRLDSVLAEPGHDVAPGKQNHSPHIEIPPPTWLIIITLLCS